MLKCLHDIGTYITTLPLNLQLIDYDVLYVVSVVKRV